MPSHGTRSIPSPTDNAVGFNCLHIYFDSGKEKAVYGLAHTVIHPERQRPTIHWTSPHETGRLSQAHPPPPTASSKQSSRPARERAAARKLVAVMAPSLSSANDAADTMSEDTFATS